MGRGNLRIYVGVAQGVGKTCALLAEGERRASRGTDVVIGCIDGRNRPHTERSIQQFTDVVARAAAPSAVPIDPKAESLRELDMGATLARAPSLVIVDDLHAVNPPSHRNPHRWQDVDDLLEAGIDVITAMNIEHLESLADVVHAIAGTRPTTPVPDTFVRAADQIELIDMDPSALRRRLAHGNIVEAVDFDLGASAYFQVESLAALRELALLWVANHVDDEVRGHVKRNHHAENIETKPRVVVAMTGAPGGDALVRRGARMAQRLRAELVGVHVQPSGQVASNDPNLDADRTTLANLGGRFAEIAGEDIAAALVAFARAENATQLIVGGTRRSRIHRLVHGSVVNRVLDCSTDIDVHVISALPEPGPVSDVGRDPVTAWRTHRSPTGRRLAWFLTFLSGPAALAVAPSQVGGAALPVALLFFVVLVATIAWMGGRAPAATATVVGLGVGVFVGRGAEIGSAANGIEVVLFVAVTAAAVTLVGRLRRTEADLMAATNEAEALARLAGGAVLDGPEPLSRLVTEICHAFDLGSVAVLTPTRHGWQPVTSAGGRPPRRPSEADVEVQLSEGAVLVLSGDIGGDHQRLLSAFTSQLRAAQLHASLEDRARKSDALRRANELRDGLLMAVSHDLRTPLTTIKLCATSLASDDVHWTEDQVIELARAIEADADRLSHLVSQVLDLGRVQSGALGVNIEATDVAGVVARALDSVPDSEGRIVTALAAPPPTANADPELLGRVIANLAANALQWSPDGTPILVRAGVVGAGVEIRIVDRGPGIAPSQRANVFEPFQRVGDWHEADVAGLGLGLALSRGFVDAMNGRLSIEDTPGGGTTMVIHLDRSRVPVEEPDETPWELTSHGAR